MRRSIIDPFKEVASGLSKADNDDIWEETPVDIEEFICGQRFLNQKWNGKTGCRPEILSIAKCVAKDNIRESMLLLGKGSGKDYVSAILHLYGIYKALCLYDPQKYYGLAPGSYIYFVNVARNEGQAKNVFFTQFTGMLENCPWFEDKHSDITSNTVKFEKRISALSGNSQAFGWLGYNTIQWVGDELAFFLENDSNEESASKAEECWEAAYGSCQTRYPNHYKMIGITTPRYDDDFVMKKCYELDSRDDGFFIQKATWDVHPKLTKEDFKHALARNYRRTMRDFGAQPMGVIESFWSEPEFVEENVCQTCRSCPVYVNRDINTDEYVCRYFDECKANPYLGNGEWAEWFSPVEGANYCMHFDLSKNKDRLGFAMAHETGKVKLELDNFELVDIAEKSNSEVDDLEIDDMFVNKALVKIDLIGWIDPRREEDSAMLKNKEIHYHSVLVNLILKLKDRGFNIVKITFDQFQCLAGSTLINTSEGVIPLRDVKTGVNVPTRRGKPGTVCAKHKYKNVYTMKIITKSGNYLTGTPNHRIEVLDFKRYKCGNKEIYGWKWKRFDEITVQDYVRLSDESFAEQLDVKKLIKLKLPKIKPSWLNGSKKYRQVTLPEYLDSKFAELLGIIWGDGNFEQKKGNRIGISLSYDELNYVSDLIKDVFNFEVNIRHNKNNDKCCAVYWESIRIGDFLRKNKIFKKSYDKKLKIPKQIMCSPKNVVGAFLRGLFSADGTIDRNDGACTLVSSSYTIIKEVKYLLQMKFGIRSTIIKTKTDGSDACFGISGTYRYQLKTTGSRQLFFENIGFCYKRKQDILLEHVNRKGRIFYERVKSVKNCGKKDVYDLTVSGDHSYVANGIVSHNSHYIKQQLEDRGFEVEMLSLDRTDEVPVSAKRAFVENRVDYPYVKILCDEAKKLKYLRGKKVDHAEKASKDIWDAVAGAIYNCEQNASLIGSFCDLTEDFED